MRRWHRRLSILVAVFMLLIASTGALLQGEMMLDGRDGPPGAPPPGGAAGGPSDEQMKAWFASALAGTRRLSANGAVMGIDLRFIGDAPIADVVLADPAPRRLRLDATSGRLLAGAPEGGRDLHGVLLELHRGAFAGRVGTGVGLACGVVLTVLSVTGFVLYLQLWWRRRAGQQPGFLW